MRYQVPQYLEVEDKIFGPFTLKQFLFLTGGVGGAYALWASLPQPIGLLAAIVVAVFCAALGFGQMNGRPFFVMLESMVSYLFSKKLYLWRKVPHAAAEKVAPEAAATSTIPRLSDSKLKELAWGLDIHETLSSRDDIAARAAPEGGHRVPTIPPDLF